MNILKKGLKIEKIDNIILSVLHYGNLNSDKDTVNSMIKSLCVS